MLNVTNSQVLSSGAQALSFWVVNPYPKYPLSYIRSLLSAKHWLTMQRPFSSHVSYPASSPQPLWQLVVVRYIEASSLEHAGRYFVPGILADMWDPAHRGHAVSLFVACLFASPAIGPIMGGLCASVLVHFYLLIFCISVTRSQLGWRWVFWILAIFSAFCAVLITFMMPETFAPVLLQKKANLKL